MDLACESSALRHRDVAAAHVILESGRTLPHTHVLSLTRPAWNRTIISIQCDEFDLSFHYDIALSGLEQGQGCCQNSCNVIGNGGDP